MRRTSDWRLDSFSVVHIFKSRTSAKEESHCIYLGYNDKKVDLALRKIHGLSPKSYIRKEISFDRGVKIRLNRAVKGNIQISSPELPGGDSVWYTVQNFSGANDNALVRYGQDYIDEVLSLISQVKVDRDTNILEGTFHTAYSNIVPQGVLFISDKMIEYNWALDNYRKNLNYDMNKKTRTINKPGHLYISKIGSYVYLGEFYNRIDDRTEKVFTKDTFNNKDKTISDVIRNRPWLLDLSAVYRDFDFTGTNVDERLIDDSSIVLGLVVCDKKIFDSDKFEMSGIWSELVKNLYKSSKKSGVTGDVIFDLINDNTSSVFKTISLLGSSKEKASLDKDAQDKLLEMTKFMIKATIYRKAKKLRYTLKSDITDKKEALSSLFEIFVQRYNIPFHESRVKFFEGLGIDIEKLIEEAFSEYVNPNNSDLLGINTLDQFREFVEVSGKECNLVVDQKPQLLSKYYYNNTKKDPVKLGEVLKSPEVEKIIREILAKADEDFGLNISNYSISEVGTKTNSGIIKRVSITLEDIINYLGGPANITKELEEYILANNFSGIEIESDCNKEVL